VANDLACNRRVVDVSGHAGAGLCHVLLDLRKAERRPSEVGRDDRLGDKSDRVAVDLQWSAACRCCVVLDAYSRRVVGWSIDNQQAASLVLSALGMAIHDRKPTAGGIIHTDHGSQFTSWAFSERVKMAGLALSMGRIGDAYDNAMMEAFWARMQTELLNRHRWRTRLELANAIFEYLEIFHNRKRRHSALGMLTPTEYENLYHTNLAA
jgi:transposase InsO family protein